MRFGRQHAGGFRQQPMEFYVQGMRRFVDQRVCCLNAGGDSF